MDIIIKHKNKAYNFITKWSIYAKTRTNNVYNCSNTNKCKCLDFLQTKLKQNIYKCY